MSDGDDATAAEDVKSAGPVKRAEPSAKPVDADRFMRVGAAGVAFAMGCMLLGALIGALAFDLGTGSKVWKARVRLMSLSAQGNYGGVLVAAGLVLALALAVVACRGKTAPRLRSGVATAAVGMGLWLSILMALNIYVDFTEFPQADLAIATALGDLAALTMAAVATVWGFSLAGAKRT